MNETKMPGFEKEKEEYTNAQDNKKSVLDDALKDIAIPLSQKKDDPDEKIKYSYTSKEGFTTARVNRGYQEISYLMDIIKKNNLNCFILGGYVRWMCSPKQDPYKAADVDVYSYSEDDFKKLKSILKYQVIDGKTYKMKQIHENDVSLTFARPEKDDHPLFFAPPIQLIKPLTQGAMVLEGNMKTVLENFDFTIVRCGLISDQEAMVDADFDYDEKKGILRLKNIHCPISSTIRCIKYGKKGYWMTPIQAIKLFMDWDMRDDSYRIKLIEMCMTFEREGITKKELNELESMMNID